MFCLFDTDKTGYVSIRSLRRAAHNLNLDLTAEDIQDMMKSVDKDKDGLISQD